ncbi:MAG: hypothetical protein ACJAUN_000218 [Alcanivorax sp.]|jgi:hypothetical protein
MGGTAIWITGTAGNVSLTHSGQTPIPFGNGGSVPLTIITT